MTIRKIMIFLFVTLLILSACTSDETRKKNYFQKGMIFFEKGEFEKADLEFRNALQISPSFADAYYMIGKVKLNQHIFKEAYINFVKAEKIDPDHMQVKLELAKIYHAAGRFDEAIEKIEIFLEKHPDNHDAQLLKGSLMIAKGKFSEAIIFFKGLMEQGYPHPEIFLNLAASYKGIKDWKSCEDILTTGIKEHPESGILYAALSDLYVNSRQINKAVTILEQGIKTSEKSIQLSVLLAKIYMGLNRVDQAVTILENIIQSESPGSVKEMNLPKTALADIYMAVGETVQAEKLLTQVLENDPENSDAQFINGRLNLFRDNTAESIKAFEKVIKSKPGFMKGHIQLAVSLVKEGNLKRAEVVLWKAAHINPHWSEPVKFHARVLFMQKEYQKAKDQLKEYIKKNPNDLSVINELGDLFVLLKEMDQAEIQYREVIQKSPQNIAGYLRLTKVLERANRKDDALKTLEKGYENNPDSKIIGEALVHYHISEKQYSRADELVQKLMDKHPDDPFVFNLAGKAFAAKKDFSNAEKAFLQSVLLAPEWKKPRGNLAQLYLTRGMKKEIIGKFRQELKNHPENPLCYSSLAHLYLQTGNIQEAMQIYEDAFHKGIEYWEINNDYAFLLADYLEKNLDKALILARKALKQNPGNPGVFDTLGWVHYKRGEFNHARVSFANALSRRPKDPSINYHMGLLAYKEGRLPRSLQYLERTIAVKRTFPEKKLVEKIMDEIRTSMPEHKDTEKYPVEKISESIEMDDIFNTDADHLIKTGLDPNDDMDGSLTDRFVNDILQEQQDKEEF